MPEDKSLGSKLLGLFVESGGKDETPAEGTGAVEPGEKTAAELVAELTSASAPKAAPLVPGRASAGAAPVPHPAAPPKVPLPTGPIEPVAVDFDAVFQKAGMDSAELDRVRKAEELLKGLPEATPQEVKRQIVEASLRAFGFDIAKIVGAAQNQVKALETYVRLNEQQTAKALADAQQQIGSLEEKIIGLRVDIEKRTQNLAGVSAAAEGRKQQVHRVLDFFSAPKV